jgi:hypothetical protein
MIAATPPYRWCTLYVDVPDPAPVVAVATAAMGPGSELDVFRVPGFTVEVHRNPDRTGGDHYLDWPVLVEVDAAGGIPDDRVVGFVAELVRSLRAAGLRVAAESDFTRELPPPDVRPRPPHTY